MSIGMALGLLMGRSRTADRWLDPWLIVFLNLPALVAIVLCYLWIGLTEAAAITAVAINKIPMVAAMIREGARALDPELEAMAKIYRMGRWDRFRHVHLPQLAPHSAAAARAGVALIWKIVLVVEFLGRPNGVGFQIHLYFQLFDVGMVLAYSLSFIVIMLAIENFVLQPWERSAGRWRTA
jgi:NitT/TauT family transport system permease protein